MTTISLKDQVAIVTGGTSGIGREIALFFALAGAKVFIIGTQESKGNEALLYIENATQRKDAIFKKADVSNTNQVDLLIKEILDETGKIDVLVNNAGITRDQLLMKMNEEDWDKVMDVNAKSCYNTCKAVIRSMIKAKKGSIINMSSVVGLTGNAGQVNYAASKAAIIGITKSLAKEVASRSIRVNCICPGFIHTPMTDMLTETQKTAVLEKIPLGRMGHPDEIAKLALFLVSDWSSYMTGQVIVADGGMVM